MHRRLLSVLGMTALLAVAACSGGGASTAPSAGTTSQTPASVAPSAAPSVAAGAACAPSTGAATVAVSIKDFTFPGTIDAKVGDVVGFTNEDSAPHTATLDDDSCTTDNIAQGASVGLTFSAPGDYPFHCKIHPKMTGTVKVTG